jgi:hypothetical protein
MGGLREALSIFLPVPRVPWRITEREGIVPSRSKSNYRRTAFYGGVRMGLRSLGFDGCGFNVMCPMSIRTLSDSARSGDAGFRDRLCELIGQIVRGVEISDTAVEISSITLTCCWQIARRHPRRLRFSTPTVAYLWGRNRRSL